MSITFLQLIRPPFDLRKINNQLSPNLLVSTKKLRKHHRNSTRRRPERTQRVKFQAGRGKQRAKCWASTLRACGLPLRALSPLGLHPSGLHFFWVCPLLLPFFGSLSCCFSCCFLVLLLMVLLVLVLLILLLCVLLAAACAAIAFSTVFSVVCASFAAAFLLLLPRRP